MMTLGSGTPGESNPLSRHFQQRGDDAVRVEDLIMTGIGLLLAFGPLAFGAVEPWSTAVLEVGVALLLATWAGSQIRDRAIIVVPNPLYRPAAAFAMVAFLQTLGLTAYWNATFTQGLRWLAYGGIIFLISQCFRRRHARPLLWGMAIFGSMVAVFSLIQNLTSNGKLYWLRTPRQAGLMFGPYVNHNHYAGLMEMLAPASLVMAFTGSRTGVARGVLIGAGVFMGSTIFISQSRGGMVAFTVQMFILAAILIRRAVGFRQAAGFLGVVFLIAASLIAFDKGRIWEQVVSMERPGSERVLGMRLMIARDTVRMFSAKPVIGWGMGTFRDVYPQFQSFPAKFVVNAAHNDYLQILAETGILGFLALVYFLVSAYCAAWARLHQEKGRTAEALVLAGLVGVTGIVVHSFVDFNLQIPANATLFFSLCALMTTSMGSSNGDGGKNCSEGTDATSLPPDLVRDEVG